MAAATAISGCTTTTHFFKGSAPFLLSCRHYRRCVFLPTTTTSRCSRLTNNNSNRSIPIVKLTPLLARSTPPLAIYYNHSTGASSVARRRVQLLLCYCTETDAQNNNISSTTTTKPAITLDGDDTKDNIREAANTLDIKVGRIIKAWRHEEADSLYVEEVDVGEPEPRTICSGLVKYIPLHLLQDKNVIVLANLKPRNMRGVKSFGMLMAASDTSHDSVELLVPPDGAVPGERVWFGSVDEKENLPDVASPNQVQKKKIWELVQPHLRTDDSCVAALGIHHMRTSAGVIVCESLKNANIS